MAENEQPLVESLPQKHASTAHLLDDDADADIGTEIVANHGDADAMGVGAARHLAEHRTIERPPPAAVNEQRERRLATRIRQEQIQRLAGRITIGQPKLGAAALERVDAIEFAFAHPAREDLLMIRHAGAVVIFGFIVDGGHARLPQNGTHIAGCLPRWQVAAELPRSGRQNLISQKP